MPGRKTMRHSEDYWELGLNKPGEVRCTAHLKTGARCARASIIGAQVCRLHGGHIPAVKAAAAVRMQSAVEDISKRLLALLDDPTVEWREKIKVMHDVLDRAGLGAANEINLKIGASDPVERLFASLLNDPTAFTDPATAPPPAPPERDYAQERLDAAQAPGSWDELLGPRVIQGEVVPELPRYPAEDRPARRKTPKHIQRALDELL